MSEKNSSDGKDNIMNLINKLARRGGNESVTTMTEVFYTYQHNEIDKINKALKMSNENERFILAVKLFRLWSEGVLDFENKKEEAQNVFGRVFLDFWFKGLMFTLSGDGKQFCVWHGLPVHMYANDIKSKHGLGLLFKVVGSPPAVSSYLEESLDIYSAFKEISVPNGCKLYMPWSMKE